MSVVSSHWSHNLPENCCETLSDLQLNTTNPTLCLLEKADYMECLHRNKLKRRIASKLVEAKHQIDVKSGHGDAHTHGH
jgi:hypothetical protein